MSKSQKKRRKSNMAGIASTSTSASYTIAQDNTITTNDYYTTTGITIGTSIPSQNVYDYYCVATDSANRIFNGQPIPVTETDKTDNKKHTQEKINPYDKKINELLKRAREGDGAYFSNIKEYVPGKVYEFTISRSPLTIFAPVKIKTVCDETDIFDLDLAFYLALSKFYNGKELTPEGYLQKAKSLQYEKKMIKKVSYGKKLFKLLQERDAWEKEQEELKKARHKKYVEKKIARKKKKEQKEDDRLTNAIKRAIKED